MAFDVEAARKSGYNDAEIADFLAKRDGFDLGAAKKSGYSDGEVIAHLSGAGVDIKPKPGFIDTAIDTVTGNQRKTAETQALPDWAGMPEMNGASVASFKSALGTLLSNPSETVQVIQANFPGVQVRQDEKGNYIMRSASNGQEYAIKPGFQVSDIPRAIGAAAAFTPAGGARTIAGAAVGAAGTQAAIEASQAATGGEFNPMEVALSGAAGGAIPLVSRLGGAALDAGKSAVARVRAPTPNPIATPPVQAAAQPVQAAVQEAVAPLTSQELAQTAKTAAEGGFGSNRATRVLAEQTAPNPKTVEAAKRLGIEEHLQPDHVTTSQAYRELAQAVKSIPGSEARAAEMQGMDAVAQRAEKLIDELGGSSDLSTLNSGVKQRMQATQSQLEKQAEKLYGEVNVAIPAKTAAPATDTLAFLKQHADEIGGENRLLPVERGLLNSLGGADGPVTYAFLDQTRKQVGKAMRKANGPFADSDSGLLKKLYSTISNDQQVVAEAMGAGPLYNAAKSSVGVRKGLEDDIVALFGKALDGSFVGPLSGSVRALAQGDTSRFLRLLNSVPESQRSEVVASGLASAFKTAGTRGPINFNTYAKWYEGLLRNKQAHTAIMSNLPRDARKRLSDLYRVSKGISDASRERITTGRINAVTEELKGADNLAGRLYEIATKNAPAAAIGTAAGSVLGPGIGGALAAAFTKGTKTEAIKAADALLTSPEFLRMARAGGNEATKAKALARSKPFERYIKAVGNPQDMTDRERWILQVVQGRINSQQD